MVLAILMVNIYSALAGYLAWCHVSSQQLSTVGIVTDDETEAQRS